MTSTLTVFEIMNVKECSKAEIDLESRREREVIKKRVECQLKWYDIYNVFTKCDESDPMNTVLGLRLFY